MEGNGAFMSIIRAVVADNRERIGSSGAPVFLVDHPEEAQQLAFLLEKILDATAHDLRNGVFILVDHKAQD
jgi:hypothetical protein